LAAQILHAGGESSLGNLAEGTYAIVLAVPNEEALCALADRLERDGVKLVRINEPDPPWNGALMAIGIRPGRKEVLRQHLSSIPLLR
jgi:hypothetical protein